MRIVADTNIVISATFWKGDSFKIMKLADKDQIRLITSLDLIEEYNKIIKCDEITDKVVNKKLIANKIIRKIIDESIIIKPKIKLDIIKEDSDDNKVIECAIVGKANYIVTKDNHLLKLKKYRGIKIITPKEFLEIIAIQKARERIRKGKFLTEQEAKKRLGGIMHKTIRIMLLQSSGKIYK